MTPTLAARLHRVLILLFSIACFAHLPAHAQNIASNDPKFYGPYYGIFLADGDGLTKPLAEKGSVIRADSALTSGVRD